MQRVKSELRSRLPRALTPSQHRRQDRRCVPAPLARHNATTPFRATLVKEIEVCTCAGAGGSASRVGEAAHVSLH